MSTNGKRNDDAVDGNDDAFLQDPEDNAELAQLAERHASHKQPKDRKPEGIVQSAALLRAKRRIAKNG